MRGHHDIHSFDAPRRGRWLAALAASAILTAGAPTRAQPAPLPAAPSPTAAKAPAAPPALTWSVGGTAWVWGLNQHGFLLGQDAPLDNADYVVHNLRLLGKVGTAHVGVVARADIAEGWWGVDNDPDVATTVTTASDGKVSGSNSANPYSLFRNKGLNYPLHVDWAWLWFDVPLVPVKVQVGRQPFVVGNRLVLDQVYNGVSAQWSPAKSLQVHGMWAKVHEGVGSQRTPVGLLMNDDDARGDGDLLGVTLRWQSAPKDGHSVSLFGLRYDDRGKDSAFWPQGLVYGYARFQPQVTEAMAFGVHAEGALPVGKGLSYNVEVDVLTGKDSIDNQDFAANLLDKNNGTLFGYNALLQVKQKLLAGVPLDAQLTLGLGSGDDDPTRGKGNINRLQTMGFFPLLNVWEDSVMPDVEGISPQGLGSPVSRGYRELENTTVAMLTLGADLRPALRLEAAYAWLRATKPIAGWDAKGPTADRSSELGQEVDVNVKWTIRPGLQLIGLYGVFLPGDGAALLIGGSTKFKDKAWEAKHVLQWSF